MTDASDLREGERVDLLFDCAAAFDFVDWVAVAPIAAYGEIEQCVEHCSGFILLGRGCECGVYPFVAGCGGEFREVATGELGVCANQAVADTANVAD